MECRSGCGACCIAPSIKTPYFGMPEGKPAGVRCVHLLPDYRCGIFAQPERPAACGAFLAEPDFCGEDREQAIRILTYLEAESAP